MKNKAVKVRTFLVSITIILFLILWAVGDIELWMKGMPSIVDDTKKFTDKNSYAIQKECSISIDLSNLQSNNGKELYNDGNDRIFVYKVDNAGRNGGGYIIHFRSAGHYSLNNAVLVSGIHHITLGEYLFTNNMSAIMTAEYKGVTYNCRIMGMSGINYKNGDMFSFYIFPNKEYEEGKISLNETGIVQLTVINLYKNIWTKNN